MFQERRRWARVNKATAQFKPSCLFPSWALLSHVFLAHHCSLSVTFKPMCTLFASFLSSPSLAWTLITFPTLRHPPLSCLSYWFSVMFKPVTCALFASFPSSAHVRCSSGDSLCWACATKQFNHVSFTAHAHYVPSGQMDTWTNGHTVRRTSAERTMYWYWLIKKKKKKKKKNTPSVSAKHANVEICETCVPFHLQ